jgi:aminomethyltransferase
MTDPALKHTPLYDAHAALGARFVPFAGYEMPVQYADGVLAEHRWTREHAGLFDVSHMGLAVLTLDSLADDPEANHQAIASVFERLVCGDIAGLRRGQQRYTLLLNQDGGVIDDLMVMRPIAPAAQGRLIMVVNAGTKAGDFALIGEALAGVATLRPATERALIALQGPEAAAVLADIIPEVAGAGFMTLVHPVWNGVHCNITRSGYTGEDGFEIMMNVSDVAALWDRLLQDERVRPIGLGARDSLRLEAGLPLYGHDLDETVSPVEAGLSFALSKHRLARMDFPGAQRIIRELAGDLTRVRVGLRVEGAPAREGAEIADATGAVVGRVTSGGFSPTLSAPIAMAFVPPALSAIGAPLQAIVRGKAQPAEVTALPFVPHRYVRKP